MYSCVERVIEMRMGEVKGLEYKAFGGEVAETEVAEDDLGGVEGVEGAAVVVAEVEGLGLHVDVGRVGSEGSHLVRKEDGGRVQMLTHAIPNHASKLLHRLLFHLSKSLSPLRARTSYNSERDV